MSHNYRRIKQRVCSPLPRRNRREHLLQRIGAAIETPVELEAVLSAQPPELREMYLEELKPHLRFHVGV